MFSLARAVDFVKFAVNIAALVGVNSEKIIAACERGKGHIPLVRVFFVRKSFIGDTIVVFVVNAFNLATKPPTPGVFVKPTVDLRIDQFGMIIVLHGKRKIIFAGVSDIRVECCGKVKL